MKRKRSFKETLNGRSPNIEPCSTPVVIHSPNVLFTLTLSFQFVK